MFDMFMRGPRVGWFLLACAALLAASGLNELQTPSPPGEAVAAEQAVLDDLNECTTGVASGLATPDGRPLLWKNRDVGNTDQEWHYVNVGLIPFIGLTYANDVSGQYYAGINAAGFALENSNSYNLGNGVARNGYGYGDDDGEIHMRALSTCRTVDDFEELLDSLVVDGITLCSNYGSFDAFGGAAMFEVAAHSYVRIDAADTPEGFIIRANYSYSGNGLDNRQSYWGPNRHDRAYGLFKQAVEDNSLTPRFIYQQVIRNLGAEGMTDYALPYEGYYQNNPYTRTTPSSGRWRAISSVRLCRLSSFAPGPCRRFSTRPTAVLYAGWPSPSQTRFTIPTVSESTPSCCTTLRAPATGTMPSPLRIKCLSEPTAS